MIKKRKKTSSLKLIHYWVGAGSVLNLCGSSDARPFIQTTNDINYEALKSDWEIIGRDFKNAINETLR